jgi:hypothetical protein
VTEPCLAYITQGKLHLQRDGGAQTVESLFGRSLRDRAIQIHNRHAWKAQGRGAQYMRGVLWAGTGSDPSEFRIAVTSVTRGRNPGEVLYTLETDEISGVFALDVNGLEQRLFHTADFRVQDIDVHPDGGAIAVSVRQKNGTANVAVLNMDGSDFTEVSEGDSVDRAPRWAPGPTRRLIFQSAGAGRDAGGRFSEFGPFAVHQLDLDSGDISCLAEDVKFDLLGPQINGDGALYYIRRPYANGQSSINPIGAATDMAMLPFRLLFAIFQFFNFFSVKYTGRPLSTSGDAAKRTQDVKRMMVWGNMIDAKCAAREDRLGDEDAPSMVPSSWQLVRQLQDSKEVLAKGVLSFHIARDGSVIYTNGSAVHQIQSNGERATRLLVGAMIEQVAAL